MRSEQEIVDMRDMIERREWSHVPGELNGVILATLRWVCDPTRSDRDILDLSDTGMDSGTTTPDAIDWLTDDSLNWDEVDQYLRQLPSQTLAIVLKSARKLSRFCLSANKIYNHQ